MSNRKATIAALALAVSTSVSIPAIAATAWGGPDNVPTAPVARVAATTSVEAADLTFMREEEKLARDVYLKLNEQYDLAIFANFSGSEQRHMDSLLNLLVKYRLPDPVAGHAIGVFVDEDLQALYNQLIAAGSTDVASAVRVGGLIEEVDLEDLNTAAANTTKADVDRVYSNLACGSRNHLRSFAATLKTLTGNAYAAQKLPQATVDAILAAPMERCGRI